MSKKTKKTIKSKTSSVLERELATTILAPVVAAPSPPPGPVVSEPEKIWNEIKDLKIDMFALPNQFVGNHCEHYDFKADPTKLFLKIRSTAVFPSLEVALGSQYVVEMATHYVIVSRAVPPPPVFLPKNNFGV